MSLSRESKLSLMASRDDDPSTRNFQVRPFDGKAINWAIYKEELIAAIVSSNKYEDLYDIVVPEEEEVAVLEGIHSEFQEKLKTGKTVRFPKPMRLLYGLLYGTCQQKAYKYFDNPAPGDGYSIWRSLLSHFEKSTLLAQISLIEDLVGFPWNAQNESDYDVSDFIRQFNLHVTIVHKACREIFPAGVPDLMLRALFIKPLRQVTHLQTIISHLDLQTDFTLDAAQQALANHNENQVNTEREKPKAFYNRVSDGCHICGSLDHKRRRCGKKCRHCNRSGHKHEDCFWKPGVGKFNMDRKTPYVPRNRHKQEQASLARENWGTDVGAAWLASSSISKSDDAYVDSACSDHLHGNRNLLSNIKKQRKIWSIAKNGETMSTHESGTLGKINGVNYGAQTKNLLSVGRFVEEKKSVIFHDGGCDAFHDPGGEIAKRLLEKTGSELHALREGRLFRLPIQNAFLSDHQPENKAILIHKRLGHVPVQRIAYAIKNNLLRGIKGWKRSQVSSIPMCECKTRRALQEWQAMFDCTDDASVHVTRTQCVS